MTMVLTNRTQVEEPQSVLWSRRARFFRVSLGHPEVGKHICPCVPNFAAIPLVRDGPTRAAFALQSAQGDAAQMRELVRRQHKRQVIRA
jgi:hypothetical protein